MINKLVDIVQNFLLSIGVFAPVFYFFSSITKPAQARPIPSMITADFISIPP